MLFNNLVTFIDAALSDWTESIDDSKIHFGELVESGIFTVL